MPKDLEKYLKQLQKNANDLNGTSDVRFDQMFTDKFMNKHTKFSTLNQFAEASNFDFNDFDNIPQEKLDDFVNQNTNFNDWNQMISEGMSNYIDNKLFS